MYKCINGFLLTVRPKKKGCFITRAADAGRNCCGDGGRIKYGDTLRWYIPTYKCIYIYKHVRVYKGQLIRIDRDAITRDEREALPKHFRETSRGHAEPISLLYGGAATAETRFRRRLGSYSFRRRTHAGRPTNPTVINGRKMAAGGWFSWRVGARRRGSRRVPIAARVREFVRPNRNGKLKLSLCDVLFRLGLIS